MGLQRSGSMSAPPSLVSKCSISCKTKQVMIETTITFTSWVNHRWLKLHHKFARSWTIPRFRVSLILLSDHQYFIAKKCVFFFSSTVCLFPVSESSKDTLTVLMRLLHLLSPPLTSSTLPSPHTPHLLYLLSSPPLSLSPHTPGRSSFHCCSLCLSLIQTASLRFPYAFPQLNEKNAGSPCSGWHLSALHSYLIIPAQILWRKEMSFCIDDLLHETEPSDWLLCYVETQVKKKYT